MRTYTVTFSVALVLQDHDDETRDLRNIDTGELCEGLDAELPTSLWCTDTNGNEHGYDVKGSTVTNTTDVVRIHGTGVAS
ncbi:MAG TPA: hypothetical protein VFO15_18050 [Xanthobacteraceae bacterium]|nr:hypothetical protein [Xanthobacteraceae bacterium]